MSRSFILAPWRTFTAEPEWGGYQQLPVAANSMMRKAR